MSLNTLSDSFPSWIPGKYNCFSWLESEKDTGCRKPVVVESSWYGWSTVTLVIEILVVFTARLSLWKRCVQRVKFPFLLCTSFLLKYRIFRTFLSYVDSKAHMRAQFGYKLEVTEINWKVKCTFSRYVRMAFSSSKASWLLKSKWQKNLTWNYFLKIFAFVFHLRCFCLLIFIYFFYISNLGSAPRNHVFLK